MKLPEIYDHFSYINESGMALDDDFNEFRDENGEVVYVPKEHWKLFEQVIVL